MEYGCIGEKLAHSFSKEIHARLADYQYELKELGSKEKYQYRYFKYEATDVIACDTLVLEMRLMGIEGVKNEGGKTIYLENPASFVSNPDIAVLQEKDGGSYEYKLSKKEKSALKK